MESSSSEDDFVVLSLLKKRKKRKYWVHPILRYREEGEESIGIITGDSKFTSGCQWLSLMLVTLEPHIRKKTTNFCELGVHGSLRCFVLRDEVDELDNRHSGFWRSLVRWLWIVKTPLKMLATDAKNAENLTRYNFFYDWRKFRRQCVNMIDTTWGRIYFSTCENFGLSVQWPLHIIEAKKRTQCCRKQVNAVIAVFHVREVNICKKCWVAVCFVCV